MHVFSLIFCILSISLTRPLPLPKDQCQLLHSPSTSFSHSFQLSPVEPWEQMATRGAASQGTLSALLNRRWRASQHTCVCSPARMFALESQTARTKMQVKDVLLKQSNRAEMQLLPAQADSCWFTNSVLKTTSQEVQQREISTKGERRTSSAFWNRGALPERFFP